jgi:hypothetical protein
MAALLVASVSLAGPVQAARPDYVYQDVQLAPFDLSRTYTVTGKRTPAGCSYTYPDFVMPPDVDRWAVRDLGIDQERCAKVVEEGMPQAGDTGAGGDAAVSVVLGSVASAMSAVSASAIPASGYSRAWFENFLGQTLTSDRTYLTWAYNGSCVVSGSTYGEWTWNTVYYSIVSYAGTQNLTCSRYFGDTWSTYRNNLNGSCYHYYYHVRVYGWYNGSITGSRSDYANCGPVWEHFEVKKTT